MATPFLTDRRIIFIVVILAFVIRIGFALVFPTPVTSDALDYHQLAENFLLKHQFGFNVHPSSYRPPLYPLFLALVYMISGNSLVAVLFFQAVFGALTVLFVFKLGRFLSTPKVGLATATIVAFDPHLIILAGMLMTEALFTLLLVAALFTTLVGFHRAQNRWFVISGILWGLGALTRPEGLLYLIVVLVVGISINRKERALSIRRSALVLGLALITIAPWTVRNTIVHKHLVVLTTNSGVNFWIGNHPKSKGGYYFPETDNPLADTSLSEVARDRLGYREGFRLILSHPLSFLRNLGLKSAIITSPLPSPIWAEISMPGVIKNIGYVFFALWFELLFIFGIAGMIFSAGRYFKMLVWLLTSGFLLYVIYVADIRFRAPLLPLLAIFTAVCVTDIKAVLNKFKERKFRLWFVSIVAFQILISLFALFAVENRYLRALQRFFNI